MTTSSAARRSRAAGLALVLLLGVTACGDDTTDAADETTTTAAADEPTTTTSSIPASLDASTPLTATGVGPIQAGMTLREAQEVSGLVLAADEVDLEMFGGTCYNARVEGQDDLGLLVRSPDDQPVTDPLDGVVSGIYLRNRDEGEERHTRTTDAGITIGDSEAEVEAVHPGAIQEEPHQYVPEGAYLYVFPEATPGYGIRYVVDETRTVTFIDVGEEHAIRLPENCA